MVGRHHQLAYIAGALLTFGMSEVTQILGRVEQRDGKAAEELLPLVYAELRRLAAAKMAQEPVGQTLQPTALVHEAWMRLVGSPTQSWNNRQHFFRAAAEAMRHILVDRARQRSAQRRGGYLQQTELSDSKAPVQLPDDELVAVHEALDRLAQRDPISADLVKLRYFVGLSMAEAAQAMCIPLRSAERLWTFAKAWLRKEIIEERS
jgi:RNA polymerase sigma factor (TIGR02999 family)